MDILLFLSVALLLLVDFFKLNKNDRKVLYIYMALSTLILAVTLLNRFEVFKASPLEIWIEKMMPLTRWVEAQLK